jgi:hypothetical protein
MMRRLALLGLAVLLATGRPALAQETATQDTQLHEVRSGDTLWDLARRYLGDPFRWPEIHSLNRGTVADPHWIYPRDRLIIPGRGGFALPFFGPTASADSPLTRTVFYAAAAEARRVTSTVRQTQPEEVPVVPPGAFYSAGLLVLEGEIQPIGQLVEVVSPTVVPLRVPPQIQPYDRVYMTLVGGAIAGDRVQLLRPGALLQPYGRVYLPTGSARVLAVQGNVATVEVDEFFDRVSLGDLAVPMPEFPVPAGVLPVEWSGLEGMILGFVPEQPLVATQDLAFVNLGTASGVAEGDEFVVYLPATQASWGIRPEEEVARVQVVRATRLTSAVRVVSLRHPALVPGLPVRLVARMPS